MNLTPFIQLSEFVYVRLNKDSDMDISNSDNWIACLSGNKLFVRYNENIIEYSVTGDFCHRKHIFSIIAALFKFKLLEKFSVCYETSPVNYRGEPKHSERDIFWWAESETDIDVNFLDTFNADHYYVEDCANRIDSCYEVNFEVYPFDSDNAF